MTPSSRLHLLLLALVAAGAGVPLLHAGPTQDVRESRFFSVDMGKKTVLAPRAEVPQVLHMQFLSITVDQPQYWPQEVVHLNVLLPTQPGTSFKVLVQKRDSASREVNGTVDANGVAVLDLMDGSKQRLELGEYRVDVRSGDGKLSGNTTFSVVEGALGALSLAHEFKQVTKAEDLDKADGGWFLGNASGAGKRWGNGLSFKNELRVGNAPYSGQVVLISRCMLPGCNGIAAGAQKTVTIQNGLVADTLDVGGHSGPFQIEFVTKEGSLRYQFEGSSHVERDMFPASGGVTWLHRVGLAPYDKTTQVPGRQLFVEKQRVDGDLFEVESLTPGTNGQVALRFNRKVDGPRVVVWSARKDGGFESREMPVGSQQLAGAVVNIPVSQPFTFVAVGAFSEGAFREGWALLLPPTGIKLDLAVPASAGPGTKVRLEISASSLLTGKGLKLGGILEAYDNRVAVKNPLQPLSSNVGDGLRNASRSISSWEDRTGMDPRVRRAAEMEESKMADTGIGGGASARKSISSPGIAASAPAPRPMGLAKKSGRGMGASAAPGDSNSGSGAEDGPSEMIREGERKVVACQTVETDASGHAVVEVVLPPQMGRVSFRFAAVDQMDAASVQKDVDVTRAASVEARLPRYLVPGATMQAVLDLNNGTQEALTLTASGAGLSKPFTEKVPPGRKTSVLPLAAGNGGNLTLTLKDGKGKILDERVQVLASLGNQTVTFSRLEVGTGAPITVAAGETATIHAGAGELLRGTVMNMVTTMESWFGHAEALSARVAVHAILLTAISRHIIQDEGLQQTLKAGLIKSTRDLQEAFLDPQTGLVHPYPSVPADPLWTAWVSHNLHTAILTMAAEQSLMAEMQASMSLMDSMVRAMDAALANAKFSMEEQGGYDAQGRHVVPVEVDGKVVWRVLTDDAVTRFASQKLMPLMDGKQQDASLAFARAVDTFRFLKAFQRVGMLQYLTQMATALYLQGDMQAFAPLFARIARGMIMAQEPGMLQGPATLGGVYSTPMAMVRFLELLLLMARDHSAQDAVPTVSSQGSNTPALVGVAMPFASGGVLNVPRFAVVRVDRKETLNMLGVPSSKPAAQAGFNATSLAMGGQGELTLQLEPGRNPLEYYALVALPSTTVLRQTEDILSDYKGQLIYGQQAMGSQKAQMVAVPFRGAATLKLWLEGAYPGTSPGVAIIRHMENPADVSFVPLAPVTVQ